MDIRKKFRIFLLYFIKYLLIMEKTCWIFLIDWNDKLVIIHPTRSSHNTFSIPKGWIEKIDWDNFETATRELLEETNIKLDEYTIIRVLPLQNVPYKSKRKTLVPFFVKIKEELNVKNFSCTSYVKDKEWKNLYPENDKFYLIKIKELISWSYYYNWFHEAQQKTLDVIQQCI